MRTRATLIFAALVPMLLLAPPPGFAATITILNNDGAGEGFNDPTLATPVGGNPGTTIGQQRLAVFQEAARIWGRRLQSNVTILVRSNFDPLPCAETSGVLGAASPATVFRDFGSGALAGTWYVIAQANAMAGSDLAAGNHDITAQFQSNLGTAGCLPSLSWYYGLDGNEGAGQTDLLATVLHELGHGLGFLSLVDESTGARLGGFIDIFSRNLFDNDAKKSWTAMTDGERQASAINDAGLVWSGANVTADAPLLLDPAPLLEVGAGAMAGSYEAAAAAFGAPLTSQGVTGDLVVVSDGVGTSSDLCETILNGAQVNGNIALIDRGTCAFTDKVIRAQNAGAIAAVVVNNTVGSPFSMVGSASGITIPAIMIRQDDGAALKAELVSNPVTATVRFDPDLEAGADANGRLRMYAPEVVQPGSSVSHWDVVASPNLLMEPFISSTLGPELDLTRSAFEDLGWPLHPVAAATVSALSAQRRESDAVVRWQSTGLGPSARVRVHRATGAAPRVELRLLSATEAASAEFVDTQPPAEEAGYWLSVDFEAGERAWFGPAVLPASSSVFRVAAAQPNPFGGQTAIRFSLPATGTVRVTLHDLRGRQVVVLEDGTLAAGSHQVTWDGRDGDGRPLSAGVYFARIQYGSQVRAQKIVLTR